MRAGFPLSGKIAGGFSNHWKIRDQNFQPLENSGAPLSLTGGRSSATPNKEAGAALIVALWVLMILSMLVASFAFDMFVESGVTAHYRQRMKAQALAQAGVEYAKLLLVKSSTVKKEGPEEGQEESQWLGALNLSKGLSVSGYQQEFASGKFSLDIMPEQGRRHIMRLEDEDWEEILDQAGVPNESWGELIDCFNDWVDGDDDHRLLGAESDDSFYEDRGYKVKNAALDTVDELLLVKGFTHAIVFGGKLDDKEGTAVQGIARNLTTWGDGKVNINTATRDVLLTLPGIEEYQVDALVKGRDGLDETAGTEDDGFTSIEEAMNYAGLNNPPLAERLTTKGESILRVVSIGESGAVRSGIWCILKASDNKITPLFWREEVME